MDGAKVRDLYAAVLGGLNSTQVGRRGALNLGGEFILSSSTGAAAAGAIRGETGPSADLGGSSKYSSENLED